MLFIHQIHQILKLFVYEKVIKETKWSIAADNLHNYRTFLFPAYLVNSRSNSRWLQHTLYHANPAKMLDYPNMQY